MNPGTVFTKCAARLEMLRDHPVLASLRYGVMWSLVPAMIAMIPLYFFVSSQRDWNLRVMDAYLASLGFMGPCCAFFIGRYLSKFYKVPCFAGPVALAVYLALLPQWPANLRQGLDVLRNTFTSGPFVGFFTAVGLGGLTVWLRAKWPRTPGAAEAAALFLGFVLIAIFRLGRFEIHEAIRVGIGRHISAADNLPAALIVVGAMTLLWFLGLQGTAIIGSFVTGVYAQLAYENMYAASAGHPLRHIVTLSFLNYPFIGGAGVTAALPFFMLKARSKKIRILGGVSLLPVLFNINEVLIYLTPLVLNTYFLIPFLTAPLFTAATTYWAVKWGWIPRFCFYIPGIYYLPSPLLGIVATIPDFTIPRSAAEFHAVLESAAASGAWKTGVLSLAQIAVTALLYYPFFRLYERKIFKEEQREEIAGARAAHSLTAQTQP